MKKINKKGFSIVEVVLAITIMSMVMVGVLSLVFQNLKVQKVNKHALVASMLAQEGLELVRNWRDRNWLTIDSSDPFNRNRWWQDIYRTLDGTFAIDSREGDTYIDFDNVASITDNNARLKQSANKFYMHDCPLGDPGCVLVDTPFYRMITVEDASNPPNLTDPNMLRVTARIMWEIKGVKKNYYAETYLTHWR